MIDQIIDRGKNVLVCVMEVDVDQYNPYPPDEVVEYIRKELRDLIFAGRAKVMLIPPIESVNYGRTVGYDIIEHVPPPEVGDVSATKIREGSL